MNVQYVDTAVLPVAGFAFGARTAGYDRLASRQVVATVAVPFAAQLVLTLTNEVLGHGLVRATAAIDTGPASSPTMSSSSSGPWPVF